MPNYNTCERVHEDVDGFFREVAKASRELRVVEGLGAIGLAESRSLMAPPIETPALPQVLPRLLEGVK
jgi:hypothetical protein